MADFKTYYEKLEKMQGWIKDDLTRSTVYGKANFLVAMGIFNYLEILGSFYSNKKTPKERFKSVFYDLLPKDKNNRYKNIYDKLEKLTRYKDEKNKPRGGAYDCLRCGLTHEYLVKTYLRNKNVKAKISFTIYGVDNSASFAINISSRDCGLELVKLSKNEYHLRIFNPRLIRDLYVAFENFKKIIRNNKDKRKIFIERAKEIGLDELE